MIELEALRKERVRERLSERLHRRHLANSSKVIDAMLSDLENGLAVVIPQRVVSYLDIMSDEQVSRLERILDNGWLE